MQVRRGLQRVAAVLALVAFAPVALADPPSAHRIGDGIRVDEAPLDLPSHSEVVELDHGLVWLKLETGATARAATKVPSGVFLTSSAWDNASRAFDGRGQRIRALEAELARLRGELQVRPAALTCPESPRCPTLEELLPSAVQVVPLGAASAVALQDVQPSRGLGVGGVLVALGLGLLVGAVGGAYLTARALR